MALGLLFSQRLPKAQGQSRFPTSVPVVRIGPIDRVPDDDHAPDVGEQSVDLTGCARQGEILRSRLPDHGLVRPPGEELRIGRRINVFISDLAEVVRFLG